MKTWKQNPTKIMCDRSLITADYQANVLRHHDEDVVSIKISGFVQHSHIKELHDYLIHQCRCSMKIDLELSELRFASSSFIAILIEMLQALNAHEGSLVLINPQQHLMSLIEITRLSDIFMIESDSLAA